MSTTTFEMGPVLASELPPAPVVPSVWFRVRHAVQTRVWERRFDRALRTASHAEQSDLIAASRRG